MNSADPGMPVDVKSSVLTRSKTFDPKVFLSTVHPNATFKDLSIGRQRLRGIILLIHTTISAQRTQCAFNLPPDSLEQRSQALKILVEQEFDNFVSVKTALTGENEPRLLGVLLRVTCALTFGKWQRRLR
jgi:exocyst complex component 2